ncbi:hypothetical protein SK3146_02477 [Paenibacillus konkukensis]|uniref:Uncharacterized protein n=1 Tax=Paenibacillus konkukensis TaxID=2020716 RepID=A0ABY4RMW2_9BACL|nr:MULTISPECIES: hypothetical protein [Paenibacillus]UQZ83290.1 hypothetical protein SK3146_02477 [Paenibacillus konkukensis]
MLLILLFILLVIVIIFRKEIKNMIAYGILAILAFGLWQVAWWGALIVVALFVVPFIGGFLLEHFKGRKQAAK